MSDSGSKFKNLLNYIGHGLKENNETINVELLKDATVTFHEYQTEVYSYGEIHVSLPPRLHRHCIARSLLGAFESSILRLANQAIGIDEFFSCVRTIALPESDDSWRGGTARPVHPSPDQTSRLWKDGYFRLFLSHSSSDKEFATVLKRWLSKVRIDLFVAHQDIEPNILWQEEIKLALSSCHAMLYLATPEANESVWCQQEIGWALGRGVFLTTYRLETDSKGFASALQGWRKEEDDLVVIREGLVDMLARDDRTEPALRSPMVQVLLESTNEAQSLFALRLLDFMKAFEPADLDRLKQYEVPAELSKSTGLISGLKTLKQRLGLAASSATMNADDDFDPFGDD